MNRPKPAAVAPVAPAEPPLKPRRRLLVVSSVVFALWVVAMIAMYLGTVHRGRW